MKEELKQNPLKLQFEVRSVNFKLYIPEIKIVFLTGLMHIPDRIVHNCF